MNADDVNSAPPTSKPTDPGAAAKTATPFMLAQRHEKPVELDMGEASREEGFRLNGCR